MSRQRYLAPLAGLAFFVLLLLSFLVLTNTPGAGASGTKVLSFYGSHKTRTEVFGLLTVLAVVVGLIFFGLLRDDLRRHESSRGLTATPFGGVVLFAASGALQAGIDWALTDSPSHYTPAAAQALNVVGNDVGYGLMISGLAVFFVMFGLAIVRSALLPAWLGWVCFPLALVAVIPPVGFIAFMGAAIWVLLVSVALWLRLASTTEAAPALA